MRAGHETRGRKLARDVLLVCGILSSLLYVGTDVSAALRWERYSYADQTVSELSAIAAPTRPFVARFGFETPASGFGPSANPAGLRAGSYSIPDQFTLAWATPGWFCTYGSGTLHITASADVGGMVSGDFNAAIKAGQNARCPQKVSGTFSVPHLKQ